MNLIKLTSITRNPSYIKLQKEEDRKADTYPIAGHDYIYIYIYIKYKNKRHGFFIVYKCIVYSLMDGLYKIFSIFNLILKLLFLVI